MDAIGRLPDKSSDVDRCRRLCSSRQPIGARWRSGRARVLNTEHAGFNTRCGSKILRTNHHYVAAVGKLLTLTCLGGGMSSVHEGWLPSGADCKPGVHCSTCPPFTYTHHCIVCVSVKTDAFCPLVSLNTIFSYLLYYLRHTVSSFSTAS